MPNIEDEFDAKFGKEFGVKFGVKFGVNERKVLLLLASNPSLSAENIAEQIGLSKRGVEKQLAVGTISRGDRYLSHSSRHTQVPVPATILGIPSDQPSRWMMLGAAMAIQENGTESLDYFAMMRGWELARSDVGKT